MRNRLESTKPLDANVEKDGAREVRYDKDSYDYLFDDLEMMSEEQPEELWSASDLGKYTIGTPTQEKQAVKGQEKNMQPVSELEFQEISDDLDLEDAEMQKKLKEEVQELEGIF